MTAIPQVTVVDALLLVATTDITTPAIEFRATQYQTERIRHDGNAYLAGLGREDLRLEVARTSLPPHGPGRSGAWRARLVPRRELL